MGRENTSCETYTVSLFAALQVLNCQKLLTGKSEDLNTGGARGNPGIQELGPRVRRRQRTCVQDLRPQRKPKAPWEVCSHGSLQPRLGQTWAQAKSWLSSPQLSPCSVSCKQLHLRASLITPFLAHSGGNHFHLFRLPQRAVHHSESQFYSLMLGWNIICEQM